jgi:DNA-3-methyladenine glycosylase
LKQDVPNLSAVFKKKFFCRSTLEVAPDLIGAILCRRLADGTILHAPIVELEAYTSDDPACHAFRGLTKRCEVMFGPGGYSYVYFIYGMYNCLNVVTEPEGEAGAVLIRAIGTEGGNGPGKLCKTWGITREHNALSLMDPNGELWIVKGPEIPKGRIGTSIRVGISQAQDRLWRFYLKDNEFVSVKNVRPHKPKKKQSQNNRQG